MGFNWHLTRIQTSVDLDSPGKRIGDLRLKSSGNEQPLGYVPVPVGVIVGSPGPTVLLTGGVHGDEYEGPVALLKLLHNLEPETINGRIIALPALNAPAVAAAARVSPLDGGNLNRAFPGSPDGGPTAMLAHFTEHVLLPECNAAIDLHAGGKAAWFMPCAMSGTSESDALSSQNLKLAEAFGAPVIWIMGKLNENRSLNSAAARTGVPMIAAELGGGGQVSRPTLATAERGIERCLQYLGVLEGTPEPTESRRIAFNSADQSVYAPHEGLFEPGFDPGDEVTAGQHAGTIYSVKEPERRPTDVYFRTSGLVLVRTHRGLIQRGELLGMVGMDV